MNMTFEGPTYWVRSLDRLVEEGIFFACIGTVRRGEFKYIIQMWHDGDSLAMRGLLEGEDFEEVVRTSECE